MQVTGIDSPLTSVDTGEQSTIEDDLPAVVEPTALTPNSETVETQSTNRYIQVKTNTLEIVIDLMGGDIVEAALPEFPDRIDTPICHLSCWRTIPRVLILLRVDWSGQMASILNSELPTPRLAAISQ